MYPGSWVCWSGTFGPSETPSICWLAAQLMARRDCQSSGVLHCLLLLSLTLGPLCLSASLTSSVSPSVGLLSISECVFSPLPTPPHSSGPNHSSFQRLPRSTPSRNSSRRCGHRPCGCSGWAGEAASCPLARPSLCWLCGIHNNDKSSHLLSAECMLGLFVPISLCSSLQNFGVGIILTFALHIRKPRPRKGLEL